jgi:hypothetical protein
MAKPKFEHGQTVKIKSGVHKGRSGVVTNTSNALGLSPTYTLDVVGIGLVLSTEETLEPVEPKPKFKFGDRVKFKPHTDLPVGRTGTVTTVRTSGDSYGVYVLGIGELVVGEEYIELAETEDQTFTDKVATTNTSDGGPSGYYDFDPGWNTFNDFLEHKAKHQWGGYSLHLKDIMKAGCRFGVKSGTTDAYDARKMIYSSLRLLGMIEGKDAMRKELEKLLADKQFQQES